jgi:hypothetical protein
MILRGIDDPVSGEHALAIVPAEARIVDDGLRRARFYAGRSVNDLAFNIEQTYRERLLALAGRTLSPGLITGLGVRLGDGGMLEIDAGTGVSAAGVIVRLATSTAVRWSELPVPGDSEPPLISVGVLVLEPAYLEDAGDADPSDPCSRDTSADAFERWARVDAGRVARIPWPENVFAGSDPADPADPAELAEQLSWQIFEVERTLTEGAIFPWEKDGVPLALVVASASEQVLHVAPWAVARRGGRVRRTRALVFGRGRPPLWQARTDWFIDQLVQRVERDGYVETDRSLATRWFTQLPPVGALPADFMELRRRNSRGIHDPIDRFFPYHIRPVAEPIPCSQVDALMTAAASLDPIRLNRDAAVGVSVVVPDELYEPELLVIEEVAQEFYDTLTAFDLRLQDLLWRRSQLRDMLAALQAAADGPDDVTVFPDPDPEAVAGETVGLGPIEVDPEDPHVVIRDEDDPREYIEQLRRQGTIGEIDWFRLISLLVGDAGQRWVGVLKVGAEQAMQFDTRKVVLRVGKIDRVDLAYSVAARPAARWMINNRVQNIAERPESRFEVRTSVEGWDSTIDDSWNRRASGESMLLIAGKLDDTALRNLQALPYLDNTATEKGPVAVLPPEDEADPETWAEQFEQQFTKARPFLVRPDSLIVIPTDTDIVNGTRRAPGANLAMVEIGGLTGPEDPRLCDLSYAVEVVNALLADPDAALKDDVLWWRVCSRLEGAEEECATTLCEGGRVAIDFKAMQLRLAQGDSGLGPDDVASLTTLGLRPWIEMMEERVRRSESAFTLSFTRCQAGIYGARQLVLGTEAATRTTTSPVLATVGVGTTDIATKQEVASFVNSFVSTAPVSGGPFIVSKGTKRRAGDAPSSPQQESAAVTRTREALAKAGFDTIAKVRKSRAASSALGRARAGQSARSPVPARTRAGGALGASLNFSYLPVSPITPFAATLSTASLSAVSAYNVPATVGVQYEYGGTGIAERVVDPFSLSVLDNAKTIRAEVTNTVSATDLYIDDIGFAGFYPKEFPDVAAAPSVLVQDTLGLRFIGKDRFVGHAILAGDYDFGINPNPNAANPTAEDEAHQVQLAISHLEHGFQAIRLAESRLVRLKRAIELAKKILPSIDACILSVRKRLEALEEKLAEARHDFTVANALLQEETARVAEINERRDRVIHEHVQNLLFHHLRSAAWDTRQVEQLLEPVLLRQVVPECLASPSEPPDELRQLLDVWREAPAAWFPQVKKQLTQIGKLGTSRDLLQRAVEKKAAPAKTLTVQPSKASGAIAGPLLLSMQSLQANIFTFHQSAAKLDTSRFAVMPWLETQQAAETVLTLGDLLDGDGVGTTVRESALLEVENIGRVATCLYDAMGEVPAILRLGWVTRLSQFDTAFDLRRLSVLPRWNEVPPLVRQTLQLHTDWLYGRVDSSRAEALALVRDLVRVCILLASHAPVDEVVSGTVTKAATVRPGVRIPVRLDPTRIRAGMSVTLYQANTAVGKGVVEDLEDGGATVSVVQAYQEVTLTTSDKVHIVEQTTGTARKLSVQPKVTTSVSYTFLGGE